MKFLAAVVLGVGLWLSLARIESDTALALVVYSVLALGMVGLAHVEGRAR